jgi:hypothetical protein
MQYMNRQIIFAYVLHKTMSKSHLQLMTHSTNKNLYATFHHSLSIYLLILGLFHSAYNSSDYIVSNNKVISE